MRLIKAIAFLVLAAASSAQEAVTAPTERLQQVLARMAELPSVAFSTTEKTSGSVRIGGAGETIRVEGTWAEGILRYAVQGHECLEHKGRLVVRQADGAFKLRRERLANGATLPFVVRPADWFALLGLQGLEVVHAEVGIFEDRPVEILTASVKGEAADELVYAGLLPEVSAFPGVVFRAAGAGAPPLRGDLTVDLAFFTDPATKRIVAVKVRGYAEAGAMGVRVAAGGRGEEEEEEAEIPEDGELRYQDGLPLRRRPKNGAKLTLDIELRDHGTAAAPELDENARALLGLRPGK